MQTAISIEELERKFDANPRRYFVALAEEYRRSGHPDRVIELCRTELTRQPAHLSGHVLLARALLAVGRDADARNALRTALEVDSENLVALRLMAEVAVRAGDVDSARSFLSRALAIEPRDSDLLATAAALEQDHEIDSSATRSAPFVTETVAELYLGQGHRAAAIEVLRQILERRPDDEDVRARLASLEAPAPAGETVRALFARFAARAARAAGEPTSVPRS